MPGASPEGTTSVEIVFRVHVQTDAQDDFFTQLTSFNAEQNAGLRATGLTSVRLLQPIMAGGSATDWEIRAVFPSLMELAQFADGSAAQGMVGTSSSGVGVVLDAIAMPGVELLEESVPQMFRAWSLVAESSS